MAVNGNGNHWFEVTVVLLMQRMKEVPKVSEAQADSS